MGYFPRAITALPVIVFLGACTRGSPSEDLGTTSSSLVGGTDDSNDPRNSNVVALLQVNGQNGGSADCSGTLITPLIVLTANHCVTGDANTDKAGLSLSELNNPTITLGSTSNSSYTISSTGQPAFRIARSLRPSDPTKLDLALVYLDPASVSKASVISPASAWAPLLGLDIRRPSFTAPTIGDQTQFTAAGWGTGTGTVAPTRQLAVTLGLGEVDGEIRSDITLQNGDSGGPLFRTTDVGARDTFGVASLQFDSTNGSYSRWADITTADNQSWILANVVDNGRGQNWLSQHPTIFGYRDHWKGEVEYLGDCDSANDIDCDHWTNAHDNCPYVLNPLQEDSNDDRIGDACPCPCDVANDYDGDLVCPDPGDPTVNPLGAACKTLPGHIIDNCPRAANHDQANCNVDAETARRAQNPTNLSLKILGDACDPVPCPLASAASPIYIGPRNCDSAVRTTGQAICAGRFVYNTLVNAPVPSHSEDADAILSTTGGFGGPPPGPDGATSSTAAFPVGSVLTGARFCQSNRSQGFDCHAASVIVDGLLNIYATPDAEQNRADRPWHRVTLTGGGAVQRGDSWGRDYDGTPQRQTWSYLADNTFWTQTSVPAKIPGADSSAYPQCLDPRTGAGTCLDGTLWYHGDTAVGSSTFFIGQTVVGLHGPGLVNHYFDIRPDSAFVENLQWGLSGSFREVALWRTLPDPWLDGLSRAAVLVMQPGGPVAVRHDGSAVQIGAAMNAGMIQRLADTSLQWASVIEPRASVGRIDQTVAAVALSGTTVLDVARLNGGILSAGGQRTFNAAATADPAPNDLGCILDAQSGSTPPERTGFATFLSRAAGGVFLLGGRDQAGSALHDIWYAPLCAPWGELHVSGYVPETILASTFSFRDNRLWVLDEIVSRDDDHDGKREHRGMREERQLRLVRIDLTTLRAEKLGVWRSREDFDAYFFALDNDGAPLLAASSSARRTSVTARFDFSHRGDLQIETVDRERAPLWTGPIVDEAGYVWMTIDSAGTIRAIQKPSLRDRSRDDDDRHEDCQAFWER